MAAGFFLGLRHRASVGLFILGCLAIGGTSTAALAGPSLILLEDNSSDQAIYQKVIESLGAVIVSNNLGHFYDHIDVLTGERATREELFAQIRKRGQKNLVDVVILTHGKSKGLILTRGNITESDIRAAGHLPRLRMVYMMACYGETLLDAWHDSGAQVVVGHQDVNSLPGFFFPRFLRRWAEGASAHDAAQDAYRFAEGAAHLLSTFIREQDLLSSVGVVRSEPVLRGVDLDLGGRTFPETSLLVEPLSQSPASVTEADSHFAYAEVNHGAYGHTDFERLSIGLLGGMIPQATLNVEAIPSAQALFEQIKAPAWGQLRDSFPRPADGLPGGLDLPTEEGQEIWIDGEAIRYFTAPLRQYGGGQVAAILDRFQGARLTRKANTLDVALYMSERFVISLKDRDLAPNWNPYEIAVPKAVRFSVSMNNGILNISGLDEGHDALNLRIKMPALPETVYVRSISANMANGKIQVEAGVIGNTIAVIAGGEVAARKFDGIDLWGSIERNLNLVSWPLLLFAPY